MRSKQLLIVAALIAAAAACSDGGGVDDAPVVEPTYDNVVDRVLKPLCTFGSCHALPIVAAELDLTTEKACDALISTPSCLFPDRMRIVPSNPDQSFFLHKLTGEFLDGTPDSTCASSNLVMPWGAAALPPEDIDLVRRWIAVGAPCDRNPDMKPPPSAPPELTGLSASNNAPLAGESITVTVTLNKNALANGQMIELETNADPDSPVISTPVQVVVPEGAAVARFEVYALRPAARFVLTARAGQSARDVMIRIGGLEIREVLADPGGIDDGKQWVKIYNKTSLSIDLTGYELQIGQASYDTIKVPFAGSPLVSLAPGACAVIGGPRQTAPGVPVYALPVNFTPDLPHPVTGGTGFALFDRLAPSIGGISTPVDTMIVGSSNSGGLRGPDGEIPSPGCPTPSQDQSALRINTGCVVAPPQPSLCP
ncbi:MAG TPA: lamin tail domain-containing protein [Kofleriaceae bacterium]|nr:lamin tail domain-containing protein [Kofleriaceae bacterium]